MLTAYPWSDLHLLLCYVLRLFFPSSLMLLLLFLSGFHLRFKIYSSLLWWENPSEEISSPEIIFIEIIDLFSLLRRTTLNNIKEFGLSDMVKFKTCQLFPLKQQGRKPWVWIMWQFTIQLQDNLQSVQCSIQDQMIFL